jgi:hypothetical protein
VIVSINNGLSRVECDTFECKSFWQVAGGRDVEKVLIDSDWSVEKVGLEGAEAVRHRCPVHKMTEMDRFIATRESDPKPQHPADAQLLIAEECDALRDMLLEKNKAYGSSFSNPLRIFSKVDVGEMINVRLDDKLSRLARGSAAGEDVELDLMGYLVLKRVLRKMQGS